MSTLPYESGQESDRLYPRVSWADGRLTVTWPVLSKGFQQAMVGINLVVTLLTAAGVFHCLNGSGARPPDRPSAAFFAVGMALNLAAGALQLRNLLRWPDVRRVLSVDRERITYAGVGTFGLFTREGPTADVVDWRWRRRRRLVHSRVRTDRIVVRMMGRRAFRFRVSASTDRPGGLTRTALADLFGMASDGPAD